MRGQLYTLRLIPVVSLLASHTIALPRRIAEKLSLSILLNTEGGNDGVQSRHAIGTIRPARHCRVVDVLPGCGQMTFPLSIAASE